MPAHRNSPPPELIALRRAADGCGSFVLVAEDEPAFFQVVRRYLDRHPIAGQGFDPVLFHFAGGVGDEDMTVIELNALAGVRQYLQDQALEFQEFFLCQRHDLFE